MKRDLSGYGIPTVDNSRLKALFFMPAGEGKKFSPVRRQSQLTASTKAELGIREGSEALASHVRSEAEDGSRHTGAWMYEGKLGNEVESPVWTVSRLG